MTTFRFSASALLLSTLVVIAWSISAASCGTLYTWSCGTSDGTFIGSADSTDPICPCPNSCCIAGPPMFTYPQPGFGRPIGGGTCSPSDAGPEGGIMCGPGTVLMGNECVPASDGGDPGDAAEDGPLPAVCSGACWPPPPHDWTTPLLLWQGPEADGGECPDAAPWVYYNGSEGNTFARGCTGDPSGICPVLGEVCAPGFQAGWSQCVVRDGVVPCPIVGAPVATEYTVEYVFNETPLVASTFCCLAAPDAGPTTN